MGGSSYYCSLTCNSYFQSRTTYATILRDVYENALQRGFRPPRPLTESLLKRLEIPDDDMEASVDLVLIAPLDEDGCIDTESFADPIPEEITGDTIVAACNFTIGDSPDLGSFRLIQDFEKYRGKLVATSVLSEDELGEDAVDVNFGGVSKFFICLYAYRILLGRFPGIEPYMIYSVLSNPQHIFDPESALTIMDQFPNWLAVADVGQNIDKPSQFWIDLLTQDRPEDSIISDAWTGNGRLYYFSRPDRFPFAEPLLRCPQGKEPCIFSKLPFDVLWYLCTTYLTIREAASLLTLSRATRAFVINHIDNIAENIISSQHPYYLPIEEAPCERGEEEYEQWELLWSPYGGTVPWCAYARACSVSLNMRNRKRIWGITERFAKEIDDFFDFSDGEEDQ